MDMLLNPQFMAGLNGIKTQFVNDWAGPLFLIIVAAVAIMFLIRREFRQLFSFLAIAVIVGLLIFFGGDLFGSGGNLTRVGKNAATSINTIVSSGRGLFF